MPPTRARGPGRPPGGPKRPEMPAQRRGRAMSVLLQMEKEGPLPRGAIRSVAKDFQVSYSTISRLWARARKSRAQGTVHTPEILSQSKFRAPPPPPLSIIQTRLLKGLNHFHCTRALRSENSPLVLASLGVRFHTPMSRR